MIINENSNLVNWNMYLKNVLLCATIVFISIVSVSGNCTLFECSSTLNQRACSARGEFLEVDTTLSCCPRCRSGLSKSILKIFIIFMVQQSKRYITHPMFKWTFHWSNTITKISFLQQFGVAQLATNQVPVHQDCNALMDHASLIKVTQNNRIRALSYFSF